MSENYIVINGKRAEPTEEQMKQLGIEVKEKKRWRANRQKEYWFVPSCNSVETRLDYYNSYDDFRYFSHNYFKTKEEAETYARVLETEMLLKKYADEHNEKFYSWKWYICTSGDGYHLTVDDMFADYSSSRRICFFSKDIAKNAIEEIGEERIKEYLTYEW